MFKPSCLVVSMACAGGSPLLSTDLVHFSTNLGMVVFSLWHSVSRWQPKTLSTNVHTITTAAPDPASAPNPRRFTSDVSFVFDVLQRRPSLQEPPQLGPDLSLLRVGCAGRDRRC